MAPNENKNDNMNEMPVEPYFGPTQVDVEPKRYRLSLWKKIAYGMGGPPMQMTSNTVGFFISIFLLEAAGVSPFYNSVIVFSGRVWDAVTDPLVGYLVSKTDTRYGRQRPWLIASIPVALAGYVLFWYVPKNSEEFKFFYYMFVYFAFQAGVTAYHVPYSSMTVVLTDCQKDRDEATAFRMGFEVLGVLLGNVIFGFIITKYRVNPQLCSNASNLTSSQPTDEQMRNMQYAYLGAGGLVAIIYFVCCVVVFTAIREHRGSVIERREPFRQAIKPIFTFKPYVRLMLGFLFVSLALQVTQGNLALYTTHSLKRPGIMGNSIILLLVSAIAFVPVLHFLALRFGKKTIFISCNLFHIPILLTSYLLPAYVQPAIVYFLMCICGVVVANAFLMPWSMLPDVIDAHMLQYGRRNEAAFYSFYVFFNKFATGFSLGMSQLVLGFSGYKKGCAQPDSVGNALRVLFSLVPMVFIIISIIFVYLYPINEAERKRIQLELSKVKQCLDDTKTERFCTVSSSATLPSMINSVDDFNSRTALAPRHSIGMTRSDSRV